MPPFRITTSRKPSGYFKILPKPPFRSFLPFYALILRNSSNRNPFFFFFFGSDVKPEQFRKEASVSMVVNSINATLFNHGNERAVKELGLWDSIDQLIDLQDSDVYSYNPESDSDPNDEEGGGTL